MTNETNIADFCLKRRELFEKFRPSFYNIFHQHLKLYWSNLTGLDVLLIDEFVKPIGNESTHDAIVRQWGKIGGDLITAILNAEKALTTGEEIHEPAQPTVKVGDTVEFFTLCCWKQAVVKSLSQKPTVMGKAGTFDTIIHFDPIQIGPEDVFEPISEWNMNSPGLGWRII